MIAQALAPPGMVIHEHHLARLAWIVSSQFDNTTANLTHKIYQVLSIAEFVELCDQREQKSRDFWDWIGAQLLALKTRIATNPDYTTNLQRRTKMTR